MSPKRRAYECQVSKPSQKRLPCVECGGHQRVGQGCSRTLVWQVAKGRLNWIVLAGGRRPPLITQCLGGRSKVARVCNLVIFTPAFRIGIIGTCTSGRRATPNTLHAHHRQTARSYEAYFYFEMQSMFAFSVLWISFPISVHSECLI